MEPARQCLFEQVFKSQDVILGRELSDLNEALRTDLDEVALTH